MKPSGPVLFRVLSSLVRSFKAESHLPGFVGVQNSRLIDIQTNRKMCEVNTVGTQVLKEFHSCSPIGHLRPSNK